MPTSRSKVTKKTRLAKACQKCRARKIKCNGNSPCATCERSGQQCTYRAEAARRRRRSVSPPRLPGASIDCGSSMPPAASSTEVERNILRTGLGVQCRDTGALRFYGSISHYTFLHWIYLRLQNKPHQGVHFDSSMGTDGLRRWGLNRFIFCPVQNTAPPNQDISPHIQLPTDLGSIFLELYFRRVHPLVPIVDYATISETWVQSNTASAVDIDPLNYHQLKLVLAIGAFVAGRSQGGDPDAGEKWAKILLKRATERIDLFSEISLAKIQFIVLRAVYAMHNCHVDEAYMYLGHAARCAIASGLNRSEITDEQQSNTHKMRLTFWVLYYLERQSSLFSGRQSAFQDDHIDTHFPEEVQYDSRTSAYPSPSIQCAWVRPMAELARVAGKVLTLSTPSTKSRTADLVTLVEVLQECEWLMRGIQNGLLPYLNFQHPAQPIGEEWQEVQRTHLGLMYHLTRVIMYRPLLQFRSLFPTVEDSQAFAAPSSANIQAGIASSIESSKLMIQLAYDVYSRRCPEVMYDTRIMSCSVYACVTLLYNILDPGPENDIAQVRETIDTVGLAVQCLNSVSNVRTAVAAQISTDIVDSVKAAWTAAGYTVDLDPGLIDILPWLIYFTPDGLFDPPAPS